MNYGQDELELSLKPRAAELGLTQAMLAQQIRHAFFGEEAQRVQRGTDDIRVMVRLPKEHRESLHTLDRIKIRTPRGANVPLATVADVNFTKAPSFVERNNGAEIIRCGCQPVDETVDILAIAKDITPRLDQLCERENLSYTFEGYVAEAEESRKQTVIGGLALFFALYAMISIALKSLTQPFFVMLAVPFAIIGAFARPHHHGHDTILSVDFRNAGTCGSLRKRHACDGRLCEPSASGRRFATRCGFRSGQPTVSPDLADVRHHFCRIVATDDGPFPASTVLDTYGGITRLWRHFRHGRDALPRSLFTSVGRRLEENAIPVFQMVFSPVSPRHRRGSCSSVDNDRLALDISACIEKFLPRQGRLNAIG